MRNVTYKMEELTCPSCIAKIEKALTKQVGVDEVKVLFNSGKVKVAYDETKADPNEYAALLNRLGYPVLSTKIEK
ncbi:heavy-metal-associated domain-containing protein [Fredinandcohnia sp. 179-A 10B2 NHS]|uniref:heavy-metal-associated domain-containing protein n=1 Tax=Fredinandcohnia sp. 179-A 10B2 NHS TaxID=3235176 RepID=UPI0039A38A82